VPDVNLFQRAVRRYIKALIVLHRTFAVLPIGARLHTAIRFHTAPFLRVVDHLPPGARLLEIGAGHGVFSCLALDAGASAVVAVEPDLRKAFGARRSFAFVAGFDDVIRGTFDAVAMLDVLYAIPKESWDPLLARIAARVKPGGVFLLKDMDPRKRLKNGWNRLQETIAIRVARLTMAGAIVFEEPAAMVERLHRAGFDAVDVVPIDRGYPHPHLLYVARKSAEAGTRYEV
jgi:SAM-dependent methyltransferase